ncbi:MAG: hypothetical protein ACOYL5_09240 [Phototrophicaceae bacterium]|jgi:hypothetical protein
MTPIPDPGQRTFLTLIIWVCAMVLAIVASTQPGGVSFGSVLITAMSLGVAYAATRGLWGLVGEDRIKALIREVQRQESGGKRKRESAAPDKVETLLALMDEDERQAFKAALRAQILNTPMTRLQDDGELDMPTSVSKLL